MASKYSSGRILQLFFIITVLFISGGMLLAMSYYTYGFVLIGLAVLSLGNLWRLYHQTNKSIAFFFDAVRNNDTTMVFPAKENNPSLNALHQSLNNLNQHIQNIKLETEFREKYYRSIIKQSTTGFVVMTKEFDIELINEAACNLAGINPNSSNPNLLKIKNPRLYQALCFIKTGENITYRNHAQFAVQQLLLKATEIKTGKKDLMLISVQDIRNELNEKELESYQKLISILTHEMMNSLAPLTSISKTLNTIFQLDGQSIQPQKLTDVQISTTIQGLKAIEEQSAGLINFVTSYRKLIKIPQPVIKGIDIKEWMEQLLILYKETFDSKHIDFEVQFQNITVMEGDKNLLNQVYFNLINNAIDALEECASNRKIKIIFSSTKEALYIQVGNNGPAIPAAILDKIFVPFFTTKDKGSGIGLSISSQIVKLLKGTLDVFSDDITGTIFTIKL